MESPYEECDFSAPSDMLGIPFVRIGASGWPAFGQTTWNFVSHNRMWQPASADTGLFERLAWHCGNEAATWRYHDILRGVSAPATGPQSRDAYWTMVREPSVFGRHKKFILSVEDFAGEWLRTYPPHEGWVGRRLLDCEAFVLFLDPTHSRFEFETEQQPFLASIQEFFASLSQHRHAIQSPLKEIPVALAVPKLDVILQYAPAAVLRRMERIIRELKATKRINEQTTLAAMQIRSQLALELSRGLFPLQRLVSLCESAVGPRNVLVFPMATLGWSDSAHKHLESLGLEQAHQYLLASSFGILDPIFWVLQRLGVRRLAAG
jgi:hypothetical protein